MVLAIQLEDVAKLDQGTVEIAGLQQFQPGLEVLFGAFLGTVAGRKAQGGDQQKGRDQGAEHGFRSLRKGRRE